MSIISDFVRSAVPPWVNFALVAALMLIAALAGGQVATWKAEKEAAENMAVAVAYSHTLEISIQKQNAAIESARAAAVAAQSAQAQAQQHVADLAKLSGSRLDKLAAATAKAKGCDEVLGKYWELRK